MAWDASDAVRGRSSDGLFSPLLSPRPFSPPGFENRKPYADISTFSLSPSQNFESVPLPHKHQHQYHQHHRVPSSHHVPSSPRQGPATPFAPLAPMSPTLAPIRPSTMISLMMGSGRPEPTVTVKIYFRFEDPVRAHYNRSYASSTHFDPDDRLLRRLSRRIDHCSKELITRKDFGALDDVREHNGTLKPPRYEVTFQIWIRGSGLWLEKAYRSFQKSPLNMENAKEVILSAHRTIGLFLMRHDKDFIWVDGPIKEQHSPVPELSQPLIGFPTPLACVPRSRFVETSQSFESLPGYAIELFFSSRWRRRQRVPWEKMIRVNSRQSTPLNLPTAEQMFWKLARRVDEAIESRKEGFEHMHRACDGLDGSYQCHHYEENAFEMYVAVTNNLGPAFTHLRRNFRTDMILFPSSDNLDCEQFLDALKPVFAESRDNADLMIEGLNDLELRVVELRGRGWAVERPLSLILGPSGSYSRRSVEAILERVETAIHYILNGNDVICRLTAHKRGHLILDKTLLAQRERGVFRRGIPDPEVEKQAFISRLESQIHDELSMVCMDTCSLDDFPQFDLKVSHPAAASYELPGVNDAPLQVSAISPQPPTVEPIPPMVEANTVTTPAASGIQPTTPKTGGEIGIQRQTHDIALSVGASEPLSEPQPNPLLSPFRQTEPEPHSVQESSPEATPADSLLSSPSETHSDPSESEQYHHAHDDGVIVTTPVMEDPEFERFPRTVDRDSMHSRLHPPPSTTKTADSISSTPSLDMSSPSGNSARHSLIMTPRYCPTTNAEGRYFHVRGDSSSDDASPQSEYPSSPTLETKRHGKLVLVPESVVAAPDVRGSLSPVSPAESFPTNIESSICSPSSTPQTVKTIDNVPSADLDPTHDHTALGEGASEPRPDKLGNSGPLSTAETPTLLPHSPHKELVLLWKDAAHSPMSTLYSDDEDQENRISFPEYDLSSPVAEHLHTRAPSPARDTLVTKPMPCAPAAFASDLVSSQGFMNGVGEISPEGLVSSHITSTAPETLLIDIAHIPVPEDHRNPVSHVDSDESFYDTGPGGDDASISAVSSTTGLTTAISDMGQRKDDAQLPCHAAEDRDLGPAVSNGGIPEINHSSGSAPKDVDASPGDTDACELDEPVAFPVEGLSQNFDLVPGSPTQDQLEDDTDVLEQLEELSRNASVGSNESGLASPDSSSDYSVLHNTRQSLGGEVYTNSTPSSDVAIRLALRGTDISLPLADYVEEQDELEFPDFEVGSETHSAPADEPEPQILLVQTATEDSLENPIDTNSMLPEPEMNTVNMGLLSPPKESPELMLVAVQTFDEEPAKTEMEVVNTSTGQHDGVARQVDADAAIPRDDLDKNDLSPPLVTQQPKPEPPLSPMSPSGHTPKISIDIPTSPSPTSSPPPRAADAEEPHLLTPTPTSAFPGPSDSRQSISSIPSTFISSSSMMTNEPKTSYERLPLSDIPLAPRPPVSFPGSAGLAGLQAEKRRHDNVGSGGRAGLKQVFMAPFRAALALSRPASLAGSRPPSIDGDESLTSQDSGQGGLKKTMGRLGRIRWGWKKDKVKGKGKRVATFPLSPPSPTHASSVPPPMIMTTLRPPTPKPLAASEIPDDNITPQQQPQDTADDRGDISLLTTDAAVEASPRPSMSSSRRSKDIPVTARPLRTSEESAGADGKVVQRLMVIFAGVTIAGKTFNAM